MIDLAIIYCVITCGYAFFRVLQIMATEPSNCPLWLNLIVVVVLCLAGPIVTPVELWSYYRVCRRTRYKRIRKLDTGFRRRHADGVRV